MSNSLTDVANSSSSSGSTRSLTSLQLDVEADRLAGQVLGRVVRGHREGDVALLPHLHPDQVRAPDPRPAGPRRARPRTASPRRPRTACRPCCPRSRSRGSRPARRRARPPSSSATESRSRSISPSTASSGTSADGLVPSSPLYDFTSGGAFTSTSAVNANGAPSAGSSAQSIVGRSIGSIPTSATAREYQPVRWSRSASSTTVSRPTWRITSGLGALPLRNPGTRTLRERSRRARGRKRDRRRLREPRYRGGRGCRRVRRPGSSYGGTPRATAPGAVL